MAPGNGEPLFLSAREVLSSLLDGGIVSADLIEDKLLRLGNPGSVFHLLPGGIVQAIGDIVCHTAGKQHWPSEPQNRSCPGAP